MAGAGELVNVRISRWTCRGWHNSTISYTLYTFYTLYLVLYTLYLYTLYLDLLTLPPFKIHKRLSTSGQPTAPLRFTQSLIQSKPQNTHICQNFHTHLVRYSLTLTQQRLAQGSIEVNSSQGSVETKSGAHFCLCGGVDNDDHWRWAMIFSPFLHKVQLESRK